jgi:hypothetical protein
MSGLPMKSQNQASRCLRGIEPVPGVWLVVDFVRTLYAQGRKNMHKNAADLDTEL